MAQAGFYHQPSASGDDRAMCFTCNVCLVCWEKNDEPWGEHERHSPSCPFVKGEYTQNVPLAITYATDPASSTSGFALISNGNQTDIICTSDDLGDITLWKVKRQLKKVANIRIRDDVHHIVPTLNIDSEYIVKLLALCTYQSSDNLLSMSSKIKGLFVVCGITVNSEMYLTTYVVNKRLKMLKPYDMNDFIGFNPNDDVEIQNETNVGENVGFLVGNNKKSSLKSIIDYEEYQVKTTYADSKVYTIIESGTGSSNEIPYLNMSDDNYNNSFDMSAQSLQQNNEHNEPAAYLASTSASSGDTEKSVFCTMTQAIHLSSLVGGDNSYVISDLIPSYDHKYILLILKKAKITTVPPENVVTKMDVDEDIVEDIEIDDDAEQSLLSDTATKTTEQSDRATDDWDNGAIQMFVFEINEFGILSVEPICSRVLFEDDAPVQICMLPNYSNSGNSSNGSRSSNLESLIENDIDPVGDSSADTDKGVFAMVCSDGSLQLLALASLRTVSQSNVKGKFVSVTYCKNLERLCACTKDGLLHFYLFYDLDVDSTDEQDDDKLNFMASDTSLACDHEVSETDGSISAAIPSTSNSPDVGAHGAAGGINAASTGAFIYAYKNDLNMADLKVLYSLTLFDEMLTQYSAEVPACWNELVQAQKQRRHPSHLRPGDDFHLTKAWRLHNDA